MLNADEMKIDKFLVVDVLKSQRDRLIVKSTVDLARCLGMAVVAEGIETEAHTACLSLLGCDMIQGYWVAKPLPILELAEFMDARMAPVRDDNRGTDAALARVTGVRFQASASGAMRTLHCGPVAPGRVVSGPDFSVAVQRRDPLFAGRRDQIAEADHGLELESQVLGIDVVLLGIARFDIGALQKLEAPSVGALLLGQAPVSLLSLSSARERRNLMLCERGK